MRLKISKNQQQKVIEKERVKEKTVLGEAKKRFKIDQQKNFI
jgi:hypothetical protein